MRTLNATAGQRTQAAWPVDGLFSRLSKLSRATADWVLGPSIPAESPVKSGVLSHLPLVTCCGGGISGQLWDLLIEAEAAQAQSKPGEADNV